MLNYRLLRLTPRNDKVGGVMPCNKVGNAKLIKLQHTQKD